MHTFCSASNSNRIECCVACMPIPCNRIRGRLNCGLMQPVLSSLRVVVTEIQKEPEFSFKEVLGLTHCQRNYGCSVLLLTYINMWALSVRLCERH